MKKLLILVIALALVGGVAMAQVTVGGIVEIRTHNNLDDFSASSSGDTRLIVQGSVDEYNSVYMRLPMGGAADRAHATTDLGAFLGTDDAGVGIHLNWGLNEWAYADLVKFTGYEYEQVQVAKVTTLGAKVSFRLMDMVNVYYAMAAENLDEVTNILVGLDTAVDVGVGTLSAEIVYGSLNVADVAEGQLGFGVKLAGIDVADGIALTTGGSFTLLDVDADTSQWGFGVAVDYAGLAGLGVSMTGLLGDDGVQDAEFDRVGVNLRVTPIDWVRFDIGSVIGVADRYENAFDSLDVSTTLSVGKAAFRIGYLYVDEDATFVIKRDLRASFNPTAPQLAAADVSGLYLRATINF